MFTNVLIAEDLQSTNESLKIIVRDLGVPTPDYVYYCDDALSRIRRQLKNETPYDLLVTDLYFEEDHSPQLLAGGEELIKAAREIQPDLKVLVFSAESKGAVIRSLFDKLHINGYVRKGRRDADELKRAIQTVYKGGHHLSPELRQQIRANAHEFSTFDIAIVSLLADGVQQKEIPDYLRERNIKPSGLSSVEKRLKEIRDALECTKNEQLIAYCKDLGII